MRRFAAGVVALAALAGCSAPSPQAAAPPGQAATPPAAAPTAPATPPVRRPPDPPPAPVGAVDPPRVLQGDLAVLRLDRAAPGTVNVQVKGLAEQPRVFELEGRPVAFIGFPAAARVGLYPVAVTWEGGRWDGQVEVVRKAFTEDRLTVTKEQEATYFDPRQEAEWKRVFALRSRSEPRPLWRGAFLPPLGGSPEITTYFGEIRFVNGVETGRHSGMDFGAATGTPFLAPARGRVILAEKLIVTGYTVILDHGMNLFTAYYHAESLAVNPGDSVEPGDRLGAVGSTGFSTGPHLHWTATVGNTPVDPWPLTQSPPLGVLPLHLRFPPDLKE